MGQDFSGNPGLPRGIRNNNPGNIRTGEPWQGITGQDAQGFLIFSSDEWGLRALAKDLYNKITRDGLNTIRGIVSKYAPAGDNNNVPAYIAAVASETGIGPDDLLEPDQQTIHDLIRAVANHENGDSSMITDADIDEGIRMVGGGFGQLVKAGAVILENNPQGSALAIGGVVLLLLWLMGK